MKAYKFRAVENFNFVIDILINKRLYCGNARSLNDIMEGDVRVGNDRGREVEVLETGLEIGRELNKYRVCALSKTFNNHLLWAYYAGGFTGMAIEVDLPDSDVTEVTYSDEFIYLSELIDSHNKEMIVRKVLSKKYKAWSHEQEVRIITTSEFYNLSNPIQRIIVGSRMSQAMISALHLICSHYKIALERTVIADWGIYTVGVQPTGLEAKTPHHQKDIATDVTLT